jgi:hypothetical protein
VDHAQHVLVSSFYENLGRWGKLHRNAIWTERVPCLLACLLGRHIGRNYRYRLSNNAATNMVACAFVLRTLLDHFQRAHSFRLGRKRLLASLWLHNTLDMALIRNLRDQPAGFTAHFRVCRLVTHAGEHLKLRVNVSLHLA